MINPNLFWFLHQPVRSEFQESQDEYKHERRDERGKLKIRGGGKGWKYKGRHQKQDRNIHKMAQILNYETK